MISIDLQRELEVVKGGAVEQVGYIACHMFLVLHFHCLLLLAIQEQQ
jgi:hypothetical protein